jgi:hypothetical protein
VDATQPRGGGKRQPQGGWGIASAVAIVAVVLVVVIGWLSLTGRLAGLQYANVPVVHPYPPAGYYVNPFTGDQRDLVRTADAHEVRSDFDRESQLQLDAFARGDRSLLPQTAAGRYLTTLDGSLQTNTASGILEQEKDNTTSVVVGHLADPNASGVTWCVEQKGSGQTRFVRKSDGSVARTLKFHFTSRYWMQRLGDHYLMVDAMIESVPD